VTTAALSVGEGTKWKSGSSSSGVYPSNTWDKVTAVLEEAKKNATFPGCVAAVGNEGGLIYTQPLGSFTYGDPDPVSHTNPPMTPDVSDDIIHTFAFPSSTLVMTRTSPCVVPGSHS
jgi:hypothetical protein